MKTHEKYVCDSPALNCQQIAAIAVAAALEGGLTSSDQTPGRGPTLTFQFQGHMEHQAACDAWRSYALSLVDVPATPASTAAQRATSQVGLALFGDPTLDLMQIADMVVSARAAAPAALLSVHRTHLEESKNAG